jgi:hypothetical protein
MRKFGVALTFAGVFGWGAAPAQERPCLHGPSETAAQAARRQAAVAFARLINTTELRAHTQAQAYYALGDLHTVPAPPDGFKAQLSSDGTTYTFSIKDSLDPCHFAFFSDQEGLIYTATPIQ